MKIVVVGDIHVSTEYFVEQVKRLEIAENAEITALTWDVKTIDEFSDLARKIEKDGSEAVKISQEIIDHMIEADIIFTHFVPVPNVVIENNDKLKLIGTCRGGVEHISTLANEKGIQVINTIRNAEPVADFTLGLMFSETRNIARSHAFIKEGKWVKEYPNSKSTRNFDEYKIGLIGFGNIGQRVGNKLTALGVEVLVYDEFMSNEVIHQINPLVTPVNLDTLYSNSDIISFHVRYDESLGAMVDKDVLSKMKKTAILINTSRSYLIDYEALYNSLVNNEIGGAALDVFPDEPFFDKWDKYRNLDNVTLTPHVAGDTVSAIPLSPRQLVNKIIELKVI